MEIFTENYNFINPLFFYLLCQFSFLLFIIILLNCNTLTAIPFPYMEILIKLLLLLLLLLLHEPLLLSWEAKSRAQLFERRLALTQG